MPRRPEWESKEPVWVFFIRWTREDEAAMVEMYEDNRTPMPDEEQAASGTKTKTIMLSLFHACDNKLSSQRRDFI